MCAGGVHMPQDAETKASKGYAFIEFSHPMVRSSCTSYCSACGDQYRSH